MRDFSPDVKDDVVKILETWERTGSTASEEKLKEILGQNNAERLFKKIRPHTNDFLMMSKKNYKICSRNLSPLIELVT